MFQKFAHSFFTLFPKKLPYIEYTPVSDEPRKIVILDGQPYYLSTGTNSAMPETWLPFVMLKGSIKINKKTFKSVSGLQEDTLTEIFLSPKTPNIYLIKRGQDVLDENLKDINAEEIEDIIISELTPQNKDDIRGRLSTKTDILNSMRLGGGIWENSKIKNKILEHLEIKLTDELLALEGKPKLETCNPDRVNQWLFENGAKDITDLCHANPIIENQLQAANRLYGCK